MTGKYATVGQDFDGMNYRTIARKMTRSGHKMNHATARNVLHAALTKIAGRIIADGGTTAHDATALSASASFQAAVGAIVQDLYAGKE